MATDAMRKALEAVEWEGWYQNEWDEFSTGYPFAACPSCGEPGPDVDPDDLPKGVIPGVHQAGCALAAALALADEAER